MRSVFLILFFSLSAGPLSEAEGACGLLRAGEIVRTQGGRLKTAKPTTRSAGGFVISQCFYEVEPFERSVSLELTRSDRAAGSPNDPKKRWEEMFRGGGGSDEQELPGKEREAKRPPRPIGGLGDEAFWISTRASGALYVLKGSVYLRISVGGGDAETVQIEKNKRLARRALSRL